MTGVADLGSELSEAYTDGGAYICNHPASGFRYRFAWLIERPSQPAA